MATILRGQLPTELLLAFGNGDGDGYGYGDGNGYGYGYGNGYGYGYGDGDGYGYGYGDGAETFYYWSQTIDTRIRDQKCSPQSECILAYWRSHPDGTPANGGSGTKAKIGLIEEVKGPLEICSARALHGTLNPPKWNGEKIWIVALYPPFQFDGDKVASLKREIICEAGFTL